MKRGERKAGGSESGPPEPWRRRALTYTYVLACSGRAGANLYWLDETICASVLREHNWGMSPHTAGHRPWELAWYAGFYSEEAARAFEGYLKSGSGRAFLYKRLLD